MYKEARMRNGLALASNTILYLFEYMMVTKVRDDEDTESENIFNERSMW